MIRKKTFLVARRELLENIRTKAFWIGILAMPIILTLSIAVPQMLDENKDARRFAVLDLSDRDIDILVDEESRLPDLQRILPHLRKLAVEGGKEFEELDDGLKIAARNLTRIDDAMLPEVAKAMADFHTPGSAASRAVAQAGGDVAEALRQNTAAIDAAFDAFKVYWAKASPDDAKKVVSGLSRSRYEKVSLEELGVEPSKPEEARAALTKILQPNGDLFAYFVIPPDPVKEAEGCLYVSNNLTDNDLRRWYTRSAEKVIQRLRFAERKIDKKAMREILAPVVFKPEKASEDGTKTEKVEGKDKAAQWIPIAFTYVLWMAIMSISQMLLTNTVEEKSNRIIEVLLSSVSPFQLMTGKIAGIASTGLTVLLAWVAFFFLFTKFAPDVLGLEIPDYMGEILRDPKLLTAFILYFLGGYLLFASILVGIGSVCNSLKEAQNLQMPVMMIMILPLLAIFPVTQDPNGTLAKMLSYIPFFTPFIMMNRAAGPPTTMEYVITSVILIAAIAICIWAAAKIFRIGVLMTGKPPKLREILGWLRAPVGAVPTKEG